MEVKKLTTDWHQTGSLGIGMDDSYKMWEVGKGGVVEIIENEPQGGLDMWSYLIKFENGITRREFNPNSVEYFKPH